MAEDKVRASISRLLFWLVVTTIALLFASEFLRLFQRSTQVMNADMLRVDPPLLVGATDFGVLYTAGRLIREGKAGSLYDPKVIAPEILRTEGFRRPELEAEHNSNEQFLRYYNPPVWGLGILPLTYLGLQDAYRAMTVINLLALGATCVLCASILGWKPLLTSLFVLGVFAYDPTHATIRGGQVSILVALSSGLSFYLARERRQLSSGISAIVTIGKPQFLALHGLGLVRKDRRAFMWLALVAVLASAPFLLVGVEGIKDYVGILRTRTDLDINNRGFALLVMSWPGFYMALVGHAIPAVLLIALQGATAALFIAVLIRGEWSLVPIAAAAAVLLAVPHSHPQDWFLLVPGAAFLLGRKTNPLCFGVSAFLLLTIFIGTNTWERGIGAASEHRTGIYLATPAAFALLAWVAALPWVERQLVTYRRVVVRSAPALVPQEQLADS